MSSPLLPFIKQGLDAGKNKTELKNALLEAGWQEEEVKEALTAYHESNLGLAVPKRRPYTTAKEAFLYSTQFATFHLMLIGFLMVWFQIINRYTTAQPNFEIMMYSGPGYSAELLRSGLAFLIVASPLFGWITYVLRKLERLAGDRRIATIKSNITYFNLFLATMVIVITLIVLVTTFLEGSATARFLLKVFAVLAVAGGSWGYFQWDLKQHQSKKQD